MPHSLRFLRGAGVRPVASFVGVGTVPSAAKAAIIFGGTYGAAEAAPLQNKAETLVFPQPVRPSELSA